MEQNTVNGFIKAFSVDSDNQLSSEFYIFVSDEARFAVACLLMASESNERKA